MEVSMEKIAVHGHGGVLEDLTEAFAMFRRGGASSRIFPDPLRRMAAEAVRRLGSVPEVAKACGVAPQSVRNWLLAFPPAPRRLAIAAAPEAESRAIADAVEPMCVASDSGVPAVPWMPAFMFRLGAGVSLEATPEQTVWLVRQLGGSV
jgi:hypothetical protein